MRIVSLTGVLFDRMLDLLFYFSGLLLMLSMLMIAVSTISRSLFGISIAGTLELSTYMLLYITVLSAPWILREGQHIAIDILPLSETAKRAVDIVTSVVGFLLFLVISWYAWAVVGDLYQTSYATNSSLAVPRFLITGIVFVASFLLTVQFARSVFVHIKNVRKSST